MLVAKQGSNSHMTAGNIIALCSSTKIKCFRKKIIIAKKLPINSYIGTREDNGLSFPQLHVMGRNFAVLFHVFPRQVAGAELNAKVAGSRFEMHLAEKKGPARPRSAWLAQVSGSMPMPRHGSTHARLARVLYTRYNNSGRGVKLHNTAIGSIVPLPFSALPLL